MLRKSLQITPKDDVVCVLEDAKKGDTVKTMDNTEVILLEDVEFAHKVLIHPLKKGDPVLKYGEEIGYMLEDAEPGTWIHNHIMGCDRGAK